MRDRLFKLFFLRVAIVLFGAVACMFSLGASIEQQDFNQLNRKSSLIFDGEVLAVESRWNSNKTSINTWVEFSVQEVLKGSWPNETIVLRFKGGEVDEMRLEIPGLIYPELGEKGVYFVESTANNQFNPLLGWSQGHFKFAKDKEGNERVCTAKGKPVVSVDEQVESQSALYEKGLVRASEEADNGLSQGRALGVTVTGESALDAAMTRRVFKEKIRQLQGDSLR